MENAANAGGLNMMMILVAVFFLFMLIFSGRGEKKKAEALKTAITNLQKDDKVVLFGGIVGTIAGFKDDFVEVKISENNKVTVLKSGIVRVLVK